MNFPSREVQRALLQLWETTGAELERRRLEALRGKEYTPQEIDSHLSLGNTYDGPKRMTSGLAEWHEKMMRAYPQYYGGGTKP